MRRLPTIRAALGLALYLGLAACGGDGGKVKEVSEPPPKPTSLELSHETLEFDAIGAKAQVVATVKDQKERDFVGAQYNWSSSNPTVAMVDAGGVVTSQANGETRILVRSSGLEAEVVVRVEQAVTAAAIDPERVVLDSIGAEQAFTAVALDRHDHPVKNVALQWKSADPEIFSIDDEGVGIANQAGETEVIASVEGGEVFATAKVVVAPSPARGGVQVSVPESILSLQPTEVRVRITDSSGNPVKGANHTVSLALGKNNAGARLGGERVVQAVDGEAIFKGLTVDKAGSGFSLIAQVPGLEPGESGLFDVLPGPAARLAFSTQPGGGASGQALAPAPRVEILDAAGNRTTSSLDLQVELGQNLIGATLSGTTTLTASGGSAVFSDLRIDKAWKGYTLRVLAEGLEPAESGVFDISPGGAHRLAFLAHPTRVAAGAPISPAVQVEVLDAAGNRVESDSSRNIRVHIVNAEGAVLGGTSTRVAVAGVATFLDLSVDRPSDPEGSGYYLQATSAGLFPADSDFFHVDPGVPSRLAFVEPMANGTSGSALPPVQVRAVDASGSPSPGATGTVTISLGQRPTGAQLAGTLSAALVNGVATFDDLWIAKAGAGYTLRAISSTLGTAESPAFQVDEGPASKLSFLQEPSNGVSMEAIAPAIRVEVQDAAGNRVTQSSAKVRLQLVSNPYGANLVEPQEADAVNGVATFANLQVDKAGSGFQLQASSSDLATAHSRTFSISAGNAARLVFRSHPNTASAGGTLSPAVVVEVQDAAGNPVSSSGLSVQIALKSNPTGALLSGATTVLTSNGVANFTGLSIDRAGGPYTLEASATDLSSATSGPIQVLPGSANLLAIPDPIPDPISGQTFSVRVEARDGQGNLSRSTTGQVNLAIDINPSGGTLAGTTTAPLIDGVATFTNLSISKAGVGYTLVATSPGLADGGSDPFTIKPGPFAALAFVEQPGTTRSREPVSALVELRDAAGNRVMDDGVPVSLSLEKNPGGATLSGGGPVLSEAGRASFTFSLDKAATGYTVRAAAGGRSVESQSFRITHADAFRLAFLSDPPNPLLSGASMTPAIQVEVQDFAGNRVLDSTHPISLELKPNAKGALLNGPKNQTAVQGVATFPDLSVGPEGTGYALVATSNLLEEATGKAFNVTPGVAAGLQFKKEPTGGRSGLPMASSVEVQAVDAAGNPTTRASGLVTLSLGKGPAGARLTGTLSASFVNGVATFTNLILDKEDTGYTLIARADGLAERESQTFSITAGAPASLAFVGTVPTVVSGSSFTVQVQVLDQAGNRSTDPVTVSLALAQNPRGDTLGGTLSATTSGGVATFSGLKLHLVANGVQLLAQANGLASDISNAFSVTPGLAKKLGFSVQPRDGAAAANLDAIRVHILDEAGNRVTTADDEIRMRLRHNPASGVLQGGTAATAVAGVAVFDTLRINRIGTYTLEAFTAEGHLLAIESEPFKIETGAAAKLAFKVNPGPSYPDFPITPAVEVQVQDAAGNPVLTASHAVTISLGLNETGAELKGTTTVNAENGVAVFPNLMIDKVGTYILNASNAILGSEPSQAFQVSLSAAHSLRFLTQPLAVPAGEPLNPIEIEILDENGDRFVSANLPVSIQLGQNPEEGVLSGTLTVIPVNGVATFDDLSISRSGQGYTLEAAMLDVDPVESETFDVLGGQPAGIRWIQHPTAVSSLEPIDPVVEVEIIDMFGERVFSFDGEVSVSVGSGPPGASLQGTLTVLAEDGRARFPGIAADLAGTYRLLVVPEQGTPSLSNQFEVGAGAPARLRFLAEPAGSFPTGQVLPEVRVAIEDAAGNQTGSTEPLQLTLVGGAGNPTLHGTVQKAGVAGVATFSDLRIEETGNFILMASAPGDAAIQPGASGIFAIHTGPTARPRFLVQPLGGKALAGLAPVEVVLQDAYGNRTNSNARVFLTLQGGAPGAVLSGGESRAAQQGKATFNGLSVDKAGANYQLVAHVETLAETDVSDPFTIEGGEPKALRWVTAPTTAVSQVAMTPAFQVEVVDVYGERVTSFNGSISLAIASGPEHAVLGGTTTVNASQGLATFPGLHLDRVGAYTLRASNGVLDPLLSPTVQVSHGAPKYLVFQESPSNAISNVAMNPAVEVAVLDGAGNLALTAYGSVTLEAAPGSPAGALLSGASAIPVDGIAKFEDLKIDLAGTYSLIARLGALSSPASHPFVVSAGPPEALAFSVQPGTAQVGEAFSVEVRVVDAAGNPTAANGITVDLSLENIQGPVPLAGKTSRATVAGLAAFDNLRVSIVGSTFVLTASADGLQPATSQVFNILPGAPTGIVWILPPQSAQAGANLGPLMLSVVDAYGNTVTTYEKKLTVAPGPSVPAEAVLSGNTETFVSGGSALLLSLNLDKAGSGYELVASTEDFGPFASAPFDVYPASPDALRFVSAPSAGVSGEPLPEVLVEVVDRFQNRTDSSLQVQLALEEGPAGAWLAGTLNRSSQAGLAAFAGLSIEMVGEGYVLEATATGLEKARSEAFAIVRSCAEPLSHCEGSCVNLDVDTANCGACGNACEEGETCQQGVCGISCPEGMSFCDGMCRDLMTDPFYCGSCEPLSACTFGQECVMGACVQQPNRIYAQWPLPPDAPVRYLSTHETVTDEVTGLIWQRRAPSGLSDYPTAESYCASLNLAGRSDWRLPNVIELLTIVDSSRWYPAYNRSIFQGGFEAVQGDSHTERFWTTTQVSGSTNQWYVDLATGQSGGAATSTAHYVRCVRGGQVVGDNNRYASVENGEAVEDLKTGLVWQKSVTPDTYTLEEARAACAAVNIGDHGDWRLPSKKELESLVDWVQTGVRINAAYFDGTEAQNYWTNSNYLKDHWDRAWYVSFNNGVSGVASATTAYRIRCVRGESEESPCAGRGEALCDDVCVEVKVDPANCGACGNTCGQGQSCVAGVCQDEPDRNWAAWRIPPASPTEYTVDPEGLTVTDEVTGLIWQRQIEAMNFTHDDALAYCANLDLAGHRDWRLPTAMELVTIVDEYRAAPRINPVFVGTPSTDYLWTSTVIPGSNNRVRIYFNDGMMGHTGRGSRHYVRCVRGGAVAQPAPHRYIVDDETVYDVYTKLTWERMPTQAVFNHSQAGAYCSRLSLAGEMDWRLPTMKELASLVDRSQFHPGIAIDYVTFPTTLGNYYRTESSAALFTTSGSTTFPSTNTGYYVRCVRDDFGTPPTCDAGYEVCNKSCVDFETDPKHCGGCGTVCGDEQICIAGTCEAAPDFNTQRWPNPPSNPLACPGNVYDGNCSYVISDDNLLIDDMITGLTWMKGPMGVTFTYEEAVNFCKNKNFAGYADWRLPTAVESLSIFYEGTGYRFYGPYLNKPVFRGNTSEDSNAHYWTSSPVASNPAQAWFMHAAEGLRASGKGSRYFTRCVRGGTQGSRPPFIVEEEVVIDPLTNLMWQRNPDPSKRRYPTNTPDSAVNYCDTLTLVGGDLGTWRVPTKRELQSIADYNRFSPAFDPDVFGYAALGDNYWSSSKYWYHNGNYNWLISVNSGGSGWTISNSTSTSYMQYVRCVRDHQP